MRGINVIISLLDNIQVNHDMYVPNVLMILYNSYNLYG